MSDKYAHWPELMVAAQAGDNKAYRTLLTEITPIIKAFIGRRLYDQNQVEDVTQEVLIGLHNARATYRSSQPFSAWLFAIARYKLIDHLRKHQRSTAKEADLTEFETFLTDGANSPEWGATIKHDLAYALNQLPDKQQHVLKLMKIEGHSVQETAESLGMSASAVKVTAHRALKTLQKQFGKL